MDCCRQKPATSASNALERQQERRVCLNRCLFVIGLILLIAGSIATGCTYSKLGPSSLYIVGAAFVVSLILFLKATPRGQIETNPRHFGDKVKRVAPAQQEQFIAHDTPRVTFSLPIGDKFKADFGNTRHYKDKIIGQLKNKGVAIDENYQCTLPPGWTVKYNKTVETNKSETYTTYYQLVANSNDEYQFLVLVQVKNYIQIDIHPDRISIPEEGWTKNPELFEEWQKV